MEIIIFCKWLNSYDRFVHHLIVEVFSLGQMLNMFSAKFQFSCDSHIILILIKNNISS